MDKETFYIATFVNTHNAIESEVLLEYLGNIRLIPIPVELSAGCGMALKSNNYEIFIEKKIPFHKIYKIEKNLFDKEINEIVLN